MFSRLTWHRKHQKQYLSLVLTTFSNLTVDGIRKKIWNDAPISNTTIVKILACFEDEKILIKSKNVGTGRPGQPGYNWSRNKLTTFKLGSPVEWIHPLGGFRDSRVIKFGMSLEIGPYAIISYGRLHRIRVPISSLRLKSLTDGNFKKRNTF